MKRSLQALFTLTVLAFPGACKVSVSTNTAESADDAKPNGDAGAQTETEAEGADGGADDGGSADTGAEDAPHDPSTTLTAKPSAAPAADGSQPAETIAVPDSACSDGTKAAGDTWKQDCNTCQCKDGKVMCTRMMCNTDSPSK